jgi:hypothetical protein
LPQRSAVFTSGVYENIVDLFHNGTALSKNLRNNDEARSFSSRLWQSSQPENLDASGTAGGIARIRFRLER